MTLHFFFFFSARAVFTRELEAHASYKFACEQGHVPIMTFSYVQTHTINAARDHIVVWIQLRRKLAVDIGFKSKAINPLMQKKWVSKGIINIGEES